MLHTPKHIQTNKYVRDEMNNQIFERFISGYIEDGYFIWFSGTENKRKWNLILFEKERKMKMHFWTSIIPV